MNPEVRALLVALRAAGWRYSVLRGEPDRNGDGSPLDDGYRDHRWTRGAQMIQLLAEVDPTNWLGVTCWLGGQGEGAYVSGGLIRRYGVTFLHRVAQLYGVFDPPTGQPTVTVVRHLSECAIFTGYPELGCTCRDSSPEWTIQ